MDSAGRCEKAMRLKKFTVPVPASVVTALSGMGLLAVLLMATLAVGASDHLDTEYPVALIVVWAMGLGLSSAPALISSLGLWRGRRWARVGITVADSWALWLLSASGPIVPWVALLAATASIAAVWRPSSKSYGENVRAHAKSGLR